MTVRIDENGDLVNVDVDGHPDPTGIVETVPSEPLPSFGNDDIARPWLFPG
ncbi:MAG: hypothetical protein ABR540_03870 [Acidimicrobiales bacterium]|nr:hypothetical protein [Actinomycetota bacterium]